MLSEITNIFYYEAIFCRQRRDTLFIGTMQDDVKNSVPQELIASKIYVIIGRKVMLDSDLAELYGVETKLLKRAVRSNITCFPDDFMFELKKEEEEFQRRKRVGFKSG